MIAHAEFILTSYLETVSLKQAAIPGNDRRFAIALALSLGLHAALLLVHPRSPRERPLSLGDERSDRFDVTLARPAAPRALPPAASAVPSQPTPAQTRKPIKSAIPAPRRLTAPAEPQRPTVQLPSEAEVRQRREAVTRFFDEIRPSPEPPPTGAQMSQQALAMARNLARGRPNEPADAPREAPFRTPQAARSEDGVNPLSMELYFEAFVQKLNRSAAFVPNDRRERGAGVAVVQVQLGADGTLRRYQIISGADQQSEIDYVRRVVERAAPFAAFPPDIRRNNDSLSFEICILPPRASATGGGFSRTFGGRDCGDLG